MKTQNQYREEITRFACMMYERQYVAATDGNLSVRLDDGSILATPTGLCKGMMKPDDLVIVDLEGQRRAGDRNVSSEIAMHLLIYRLRADVRGIVHAHPPTATGFAAAGMALDQPLLSEAVLCLGSVPLAPYGTPGTSELTDALMPLVPSHDAILMANHGVVTYAQDLHRAYMKMEVVEHYAKVALVTIMLGRQKLLGEEEVEKLVAARAIYAGTAPVISGHSNGDSDRTTRDKSDT
jgi:L-fuculose-phosphate aldolase